MKDALIIIIIIILVTCSLRHYSTGFQGVRDIRVTCSLFNFKGEGGGGGRYRVI